MRKTVIILISFVLSGIAFYSCDSIIGVNGSGNVVSESRQISSFEELKVSGAFNVLLKQGSKESLEIETDDNLLELIETEVSGNQLRIGAKQNIGKSTKLNIYLTFVTLKSMNISGAVDISGEDQLRFDELTCKGSGASGLDLQITAKELLLDFSGASGISLSGKASRVVMEVSSASEIHATDLEIEHLTADLSGASDADVYVTKELSVDASGASNFSYEGNPKIISESVSGAGDVRKR